MKLPQDMEGRQSQKSYQLLEKANERGLIEELTKQLNKDLSMCGLNVFIAEKQVPGEIVQNLKNILEDLVRDDFQGFLNLLYRVDVPKTRMRQSEESTFTDYIDKCAYELLKREWQKVWIRNKIQ